MTTAQHLAYIGASENANGNETRTWADGVPITGCTFAPNGSSELDDGRAQQTPRLFVPSTVTVGFRDRFTIAGVTYEVDGVPEDWSDDPFDTGWDPGELLVPLKVVG